MSVVHPIHVGTRVSVGNELGRVQYSLRGKTVLESPTNFDADYYQYKILFDGGHSAMVEQWWVTPT